MPVKEERVLRAGRSVWFVVAIVAGLAFAPAAVADTAKYILPPGNFGGVRFTPNSLDQLPLYDALTPLRGNMTMADINKLYLPENFTPIGATHDGEHRPARACGWSTTRTASRTSTARRARTWPSAPAGPPLATAAC